MAVKIMVEYKANMQENEKYVKFNMGFSSTANKTSYGHSYVFRHGIK